MKFIVALSEFDNFMLCNVVISCEGFVLLKKYDSY